MARKTFTTEQIICMLGEAEVRLSGATMVVSISTMPNG